MRDHNLSIRECDGKCGAGYDDTDFLWTSPTGRLHTTRSCRCRKCDGLKPKTNEQLLKAWREKYGKTENRND